jgi:hypothetical protein
MGRCGWQAAATGVQFALFYATWGLLVYLGNSGGSSGLGLSCGFGDLEGCGQVACLSVNTICV